jgi:hypothetical protein
MPYILLLDRDHDGRFMTIVGFETETEAELYQKDWEARHPHGRADLEIIELHSTWQSAKAGEVEFN